MNSSDTAIETRSPGSLSTNNRAQLPAGARVLVTGGASGIGRITALKLHEMGLDTYVIDAAKPQDLDDGIHTVTQDITDIDAARKAIASLPSFNYLVNAAGISAPCDIADVTPELWDKVHNVNLKSIFFLIQAISPAMTHGDAIVNIASINGMEATNVREGPYNSSKAGVIALTKTWSRELAPRGIRVNCVSPGVTDTPMLTQIFDTESIESGTPVPELVADYLKRVPLRRLAEPSEIADTITFLLGTGASYITGQNVSVCGGMMTP